MVSARGVPHDQDNVGRSRFGRWRERRGPSDRGVWLIPTGTAMMVIEPSTTSDQSRIGISANAPKGEPGLRVAQRAANAQPKTRATTRLGVMISRRKTNHARLDG